MKTQWDDNDRYKLPRLNILSAVKLNQFLDHSELFWNSDFKPSTFNIDVKSGREPCRIASFIGTYDDFDNR